MPYETHPDLPDIPDDDVVLWRYIDLAKYLDLLQTAELHFTRADSMEDRWEGSYSPVNVAVRPAMWGEHFALVSAAKAQISDHARTHTYLNCWYEGIDESYAMWRLYDPTGQGVAITTTTGDLRRSLTGPEHVWGARVQYVNYTTTFIPERNMFSAFVYKRLSFKHESEYRLLGAVFDQAAPPLFKREPVDLEALIAAVYVSPDAPEWTARVVTDVTEHYLPGVEVRHSDLRADPIA